MTKKRCNFKLAVALRWAHVQNGGISEMGTCSKWRHPWGCCVFKMALYLCWSHVYKMAVSLRWSHVYKMAVSLRWSCVPNGGTSEMVLCSKWRYLRWSCVQNGGTSEMVACSKWRHLWDGLLVKMAASPRWSQVLSWLRVSPRDVVRLTTVKNYIMGKSNNKQRQTQPARAAEQECQHLLSRYSQVGPRYSYIIVGQKEDDQER